LVRFLSDHGFRYINIHVVPSASCMTGNISLMHAVRLHFVSLIHFYICQKNNFQYSVKNVMGFLFDSKKGS